MPLYSKLHAECEQYAKSFEDRIAALYPKTIIVREGSTVVIDACI